MAIVERFQNPVCGSSINLRLFTYNSNIKTNVSNVTSIDIYFLDHYNVSEANPKGQRLIKTIQASEIENVDSGEYLTQIQVDPPEFGIGQYYDVWNITFTDTDDCGSGSITNYFTVYPDLWFASPVPPTYDFSFQFRPNRIVKGSKRYLTVQVTPNTPKGSDLQAFYDNLAIISDLKISIAAACGECLPAEEDLRLIVDKQIIVFRERHYAFYQIDTSELNKGIYDVWFELTFSDSIFVSEKNQLQIV